MIFCSKLSEDRQMATKKKALAKKAKKVIRRKKAVKKAIKRSPKKVVKAARKKAKAVAPKKSRVILEPETSVATFEIVETEFYESPNPEIDIEEEDLAV